MIARPLLARLEAVRDEVDLEVLRPTPFELFERAVREAAAAGKPYQGEGRVASIEQDQS
ncbi:MAG TPA: hypothetical protein VFA46_21625 [Actinomycetes bacterium]|jgi:hypothetical protein|nr:hypothetical protein [Actinomycetes bacterium]